MITGILDINSDDINKNIRLFKTDINNRYIYINNEKIDTVKENNDWKYNFKKEGKYTLNIKFKNIITNMRAFFEKSSNIISLDFSYFNTSNISNMALLFSHCNKLKEIK